MSFSSHNRVVHAGLNPFDWESWVRSEGTVLHKIVLNKQQAELCVVAEGFFRSTEKELDEFIERKGISMIGSQRVFEEDNYEKSFVPLLEYSGDYNLPEVLIPFCVKAKVAYRSKLLILYLKLKRWYKKTTTGKEDF